MSEKPTPAIVRAMSEASAKWNVTIRYDAGVVIVTPKGMDAEDDFDMVRMKRK
jgi:hypothetical protein